MLRKAIVSNHKLTTRIRKNASVNWKPQYRLQIGSKEWFTDLTKLGLVQSKSNVLKFPSVPNVVLGHFIRGYFDGDGCVYLGKHFSSWHKKDTWSFSTRFTSGSKRFLEQLHRTLRERGCRGGFLSKKTRGYELVFSRHDSLALSRLMYHTDKTPDLFLPRKRQKMEKGIRVLKLERAGVAQFG